MTPRDWWKSATIYQIYPRSFMDSNGDGIGDLPGIERRLDHLTALGVDTVWISPIFPSPMADFGYDVSDYTGIDPIFGTLEEFDALAAAIRARGLRLLLDFVPGHSSEAHPWFVESRASRDNPRRDWYVWRDPAPDGGPPTNWLSHFGGPAWTRDEATGQYYLHMFLPEQPNLNWRNPELRAAMLDAMRFWYDRGVDGFRVDAFENVSADPEAGDNPPDPDWTPGLPEPLRFLQHATQHRPEVFDVARDMRALAESYDPPRLLVGEVYGPLDVLMRYYGDRLDAFQLPFNFQMIGMDWDAGRVAALISEYESLLPEGAWPNWVLGNHDRQRPATRFGAANARASMTLLLTLRGTPTIYQGEELGMEDVPVPPERVVDPWGINVPGFGRDPVRTPIPWGDAAGFGEGEPWLPIGTPEEGGVAQQDADPGSTLSMTRRLLALRAATPALHSGAISEIGAERDVLTYTRSGEGGPLRVAINFSDGPRPAPEGTAVFSSHGEDGAAPGTLRPHEARILRP